MKFLTHKRFYYLMIGLNVLTFLAIFAVAYYGNTFIQKESDRLKVAKSEARLTDEQQISLIQAKKDLEKYSSLNEILKSVVPQDKDQAKTIREISKIASESGVPITDIRFQTSTLGQKAPTPVTTTEGEGAAAAATTLPAAAPVTNLSQLKPVDGIKGVYGLEITVTTATATELEGVTYADLIRFLERLENNRRTAHVSKIAISPSAKGTYLSFVVTLIAYVKP